MLMLDNKLCLTSVVEFLRRGRVDRGRGGGKGVVVVDSSKRKVDEDVIMVLKGELADLMTQIAPEVYRKYVTVDRKGTPILYVKLQKALYGLMRASLLFYRKLRKEFE